MLATPKVSAPTSNEEEVSHIHFSLSPAFISSKHSCGSCPMLNSSIPESALSLSHVGRSIHNVHSDSFEALIPLECKSAGLFFPRQCLQLFTGTSVLISFTRFWTNGFHSLSSPLIQASATLESVHQVKSVISTSGPNASLMWLISLANIKAARSTNLRIVSCFTGATLDRKAKAGYTRASFL